MSAPSAYRIGQVMEAWQRARNHIITEDPDLALDEAGLAGLLGSDQDDAISILNRLLHAAAYAEDMSKLAEAQARAIQERSSRFANRALATRTAAFHVMDAMGLKRHELPDMTASMRAGGVSVMIINDDTIPDECKRTIPEKKEPDLKLIGARLKAIRDWESARDKALADGFDPETIPEPPPDVPGATLSNGMPTLVIRRK